MQIREPKFELGQKVVDKKGHVGNVTKVDSYHFDEDEYWYDVSCDEITPGFYTEHYLDPYIEKPKSVWDLKEGDTYYVIFGDGKVTETTWGCCDKKFREIGNTFLTKEEAEFEVERRKVETEMLRLGGRRTFKKGENNWLIYYNDGLNVTVFNESALQGAIYFDLENEASNAIETIGEERINKYLFGVEE